LAAVVGIDTSSIFINDVREGSVIIDYTITVEQEGLSKGDLSYK